MTSKNQNQKNLNDVSNAWGRFQTLAMIRLPESRVYITAVANSIQSSSHLGRFR